VYSLYADLCEGRLERSDLKRILKTGRVYSDARKACLNAFERLEQGPVVEVILIHLDRQTSPGHFAMYGTRVVPFYNYLQAAFVLSDLGRLPVPSTLRIAEELLREHRFDAEALTRSFAELRRRGHVSDALSSRLGAAVDELGAVASEGLRLMCDGIHQLEPASHATMSETRDPHDTARGAERSAEVEVEVEGLAARYLALAKEHCGGRNRRRLR
jgi:hypothetical protein